MKIKIILLFILFYNTKAKAQFQRTWLLGQDSINMAYIDFKDVGGEMTVKWTNNGGIPVIPYWESSVSYVNPKGFGFSFNGWKQSPSSTYNSTQQDKYGNFYPFQLKNAAQCIVTVPKPTQFYRSSYTVFTSDSLGDKNNKFYYIYVDDSSTLKIEGRLIRCLVKGKELMEGSFQAGGITACKHGNGEDWWTILADNKEKRFYAVLMDKDTIKLHHTQDIGCYYDNKEKTWAHFSPDGKYYIRYQQWAGNQHVINLYDFDRCTGKLSNHRFLFQTEVNDSHNGSVCISPNSKYLYLSTGYSLYQLELANLNSPAIELSTTADTTSACGWKGCGFNRMIIAPDEKLYIIDETEAYLHIIDNPNEKGLACGLRRGVKGLILPVENNIKVFPNHTNYSLEKAACFVATEDALAEKEKIVVLPNPGNDYFSIRNKNNEQFDITIFNSIGRLIFQAKNINEVNTNHWQSGVYFIEIRKNKELFHVEKWIKM